MHQSVRHPAVRLFPIGLALAALVAGVGSVRAAAQDSAPPPPPPLDTAQARLPQFRSLNRGPVEADSIWPANADLLNQALLPYRVNLAGISDTQRAGLGRATRELIGPIDWNRYRINSLQAAAIVFYGLTLYGGVQAVGPATGPCPGPVDCGEPVAKIAELVRYPQRLADGFGVLNPSRDREILDYFYNTAVSLAVGFGRCGCGSAAGAAQQLRDGAKGLYSEFAIFPSQLQTIVQFASVVQKESDPCLRQH
jgi:hypothetical protein